MSILNGIRVWRGWHINSGVVGGGPGTGPATPPPASRGENGAFLDPYWFNGTDAIGDAEMIARIKSLRTFHINHYFIDVGVLSDTGTYTRDNEESPDLNAYTPSIVKRWIELMRIHHPGARAIAMVNYRKFRISDRPVGFDINTFKANLDAECAALMSSDIGCDGIHLDLERYNQNGQDLLDVLSYLRQNSCAGGREVSISLPSDVDWLSDGYIRSICEHVDYLNPMCYDLGHPDAATYSASVKATMDYYARGMTGTRAKLMPSVPSYADNTWGHDSAVENIPSYMEGAENATTKPVGYSIFWWPTFIGMLPEQLPPDHYLKDQVDWLTRHVYKMS